MNRGTDRPEDRFADDMAAIDLDAIGRELLDKAANSTHAHAQRTLYKHSGLTAALFAFQAGGSLPEHQARGVVTINVITGSILLRTNAQSRPLSTHQFARLAPGIPHAVECNEQAVILVHIGMSP